MREELQRRIGAAIDSPDGITGDAELRGILAEDADAAAYARDVVRLQSTLRNWPLPEPSDDAFETLAARIEQRLGDALPRIADPTLAPQFDDDDDLRDATAGLLGPVISSGEFELEESKSVPPPARPLPPPAATTTAVASARPAPTSAPPAPPGVKPPMAAPRAMPKLAPSNDGDRLSFPTFAPTPLDGPAIGSAKIGDLQKKRRERGRFGWIAGLAAAAAVGLGVFATTSNYSGEPAPSPQAASGAATATGGLMAARQASDEPSAPAEAPAPAQDLMAEASPPMPAAPPPRPVAAALAAPRLAEGESRRGGAAARDDDFDERRPARRARAAPGAAAPALPMRVDTQPAAREPASSAPRDESAASGGGASARAESPRTAATTPPADLPAAPERGAVLAAIQAVEPTVRACAADEHGTATVRIVVAGSGRVTTATVTGQFAGTPVGSCVARAVRTGRFPQFSGDRFEVTYPFQL